LEDGLQKWILTIQNDLTSHTRLLHNIDGFFERGNCSILFNCERFTDLSRTAFFGEFVRDTNHGFTANCGKEGVGFSERQLYVKGDCASVKE
jgi:hypothetical protein